MHFKNNIEKAPNLLWNEIIISILKVINEHNNIDWNDIISNTLSTVVTHYDWNVETIIHNWIIMLEFPEV